MIVLEGRACALSSPVVRIAARRGGSEDVMPERCSDLVTCLAGLPDPRDRRGQRYRLASVLAVAVCAVLAGAKSLAAIGEWAADAPWDVLVALGVRSTGGSCCSSAGPRRLDA